MKLLHILVHVIVLTVTSLLYFMWVTPAEADNAFLSQLIVLCCIYAAVTLLTEYLVCRFFLPDRSKYRPPEDAAYMVYKGEDKAIAAACNELGIDNTLDGVINQGKDNRGTYLWIHDRRYNVNSDKYYYIIIEENVHL